MESDPEEAVINFLRSLPDTIRSNWLHITRGFLSFALGLPDLGDVETTSMQQVSGMLGGRTFVPARTGALVAICAAIDQVVAVKAWNAQERFSEQFNENHAEEFEREFDDSSLRENALRLPLIRKHEAAAAETWRALRVSILSPESIEAASRHWSFPPTTP
jgi:hypothetical protein